MNSMYLDLLESVLTGMIDRDPGYSGEFDFQTREIGGDWPTRALTMIGIKRLHQLRLACEDVIKRDVPGDFVECGVWRGGAVIMMRAVLHALDDPFRTVYACDSFEGLPAPTSDVDRDLDLHTKKELAVGVEEVMSNLERFGLNDLKVYYSQGDFKYLPGQIENSISVLRLDGDMYSSTMHCLRALYPLLSVGGYCIIDDYGAMHQCRRAVEEYRAEKGLTEKSTEIDWSGIYWIKEKEVAKETTEEKIERFDRY